jgi:hypothetical protein
MLRFMKGYPKPSFYVCFIISLLGYACADNPTSSDTGTLTGSGTLTTEVRALPAFRSVQLNTVGTVNLSSGGTQRVSITVNDNLLQYIILSVVGETLNVDTEPGHLFNNLNLTVDLTMTDLETLTVNGVGTISSTNSFMVDSVTLGLNGAGSINLTVEAVQLNSTHTGAGTITLNGKVDTHTAGIQGAGPLLAFGLISETSTVTIGGAAKAEVYVNQVLNATITGSGSIYFKGWPTINATITGTGSVIDAN